MCALSESERNALMQKEYLNKKEVAQLCGITPVTLARWIDKIHWFQPERIDGKNSYRFHARDVEGALHIAKLTQELGYPLFAVSPPIKQPEVERKIKFWFQPEPEIDGVSLVDEKEKTYRLPMEYALNADMIMDVCNTDERTAKHYLRVKRAPYAVCRLLSLHCRGRILPDKWTHMFINCKGNLEINKVGEVSEAEIETMRWEKAFHIGANRTLRTSLDKARDRIKQLEAFLEDARVKLGQTPAANDARH